jgi:hypothetical protein
MCIAGAQLPRVLRGYRLLGVLMVAARMVAEIASPVLVAARVYGTTRPSAPRKR